MAKIKVKDLSIGMRLAADVCDLNGRFLIGTECVITEKHIKALNAWGVISVDIDGDDIGEEHQVNSISNDLLDKCRKNLQQKLKHNDLEHPFIAELLIEATNYHASKKSGY